ncbi:glutamyl-Q tRNA(Asp) synthetase [Sphingomonas sp.]|uniref:glutamyl-Q tRNA(Asp) synthetase n=1 Tax=Sphingomonas sp. TaxID=28214 RepID=UPI0033424776
MIAPVMPVTRFAPSPTGKLHLGHAYSAIQAHDRARARGGTFLLRIEDIDGARSRPEHVAAIEADLRWLGLEWDGPVLFQSTRLAVYAAALERLRGDGLLYPCFCTRAEIAASLSAPHGGEAVYPGMCRGLSAGERAGRIAAGERYAWRLDVVRAMVALSPPLPGRASGEQRPALFRSGRGPDRPDAGIEGWVDVGDDVRSPHEPTPNPSLAGRGGKSGMLLWHDEIAGEIIADPLTHGDVVLARKDAPASYHLAVTLDDAAQGISHVVRGVDLFAATHVHRLLQALLGLPTPIYRHHPLLVGADGQRLAKRNGAPTLESVRLRGEDGLALANRLRARSLPIGFVLAST